MVIIYPVFFEIISFQVFCSIFGHLVFTSDNKWSFTSVLFNLSPQTLMNFKQVVCESPATIMPSFVDLCSFLRGGPFAFK